MGNKLKRNISHMCIINYPTYKEHIICPNRKHTVSEGRIHEYSSYSNALSSGWSVTDNSRFCKPGQISVLICPSCTKLLKEEK